MRPRELSASSILGWNDEKRLEHFESGGDLARLWNRPHNLPQGLYGWPPDIYGILHRSQESSVVNEKWSTALVRRPRAV